jgi:NAD(P)H-nitrite reductase large subunit
METDVPGIYACGDVVEAYDFVFGGKRVVPIWPGAYMGGRVAGFNMAGRAAESREATTMNSLKYFGLPIVSAGEINVDGETGYEVLRRFDPDRRYYKKIVLKEGRLVGFVFAEDIERAGIVFALLRQGVVVDSLHDALLGEGFDLVKLPHQLRRAHYEAAGRAGINGKYNGSIAEPAVSRLT